MVPVNVEESRAFSAIAQSYSAKTLTPHPSTCALSLLKQKNSGTKRVVRSVWRPAERIRHHVELQFHSEADKNAFKRRLDHVHELLTPHDSCSVDNEVLFVFCRA